ncbi:MAG TPA: acetolactate synthase small subunit, partial [Sulfuricaulis sp.]|nr:acetolactate synthase small subunit [Sulfuricaulis sp.]
MRHTISMLLENESGALSRVSGLFSARGYNIESLTVAPTEDETLSRLTLVTSGSEDVIEQITKQLNKLVDVVKLVDLTDGQHIEREMLLIKVNAGDATRDEIRRAVDEHQARILDESETTCTIELTGSSDTLDAFVTAVSRAGI